MARRKTQNEFIQEAKAIYGERFAYDDVIYLNTYTHITIYCLKHKKHFRRTPQRFLAKVDPKHCPDCMKLTKKVTSEARRNFEPMMVDGKSYTSVRELARNHKGVSAKKLRELIENKHSAEDAIKILKSKALDGRRKKIIVNGTEYATRKEAIHDLEIPDMWLYRAVNDANDPSNIIIDEEKINQLKRDRLEHASLDYLRPILMEQGLMQHEKWFEIKITDLPYDLQNGIRSGWKTFVDFLEELFPDVDIEWWRLPHVPSGFWKLSNRRMEYLAWLEVTLGFKKPEDWYKVKSDDFKNNFGGALLIEFDQYQLCQELHPNFDYKMFKFQTTPQGYWQSSAAAKEFLNYILSQENWDSIDDFHKLTNSILKNYGGASLLNKHAPWGNKIWDMLNIIYPNHNWRFWDFSKSSAGLWAQPTLQLQFLKHLEYVLGINEPEDWYNVSEADFVNNGGQTLVHMYGDSPALVIVTNFPNLNLDHNKFKFNSKAENRIAEILKDLFPDYFFIRRHKHPSLVFTSGRKMELDFFCEELSLAIEYDGIQHFEQIDHWGGEASLLEIQRRDEEKNQACEQNGISLIRINQNNWDGSKKLFLAHVEKYLKY